MLQYEVINPHQPTVVRFFDSTVPDNFVINQHALQKMTSVTKIGETMNTITQIQEEGITVILQKVF